MGEVFSRAAFDTLIDKIDECKADSEINWKVGVRTASTARWAKICLRRLAWTSSMSVESRPSTLPQMGLARLTGQSTSRKTRSGRPFVHRQLRQQCTLSRK